AAAARCGRALGGYRSAARPRRRLRKSAETCQVALDCPHDHAMNAIVDPAASAPKRRNIFILIAVIFIVLGLLWGAYWALVLAKREQTDDAYVNGNKVVISAQISGTV